MGTISLILPQIGLSDSTEDVKIPNALTTIQTWANGNVDTNNLSATAAITRSQLAGGSGNLAMSTVSSNTSAVDGHFYNAGAGSITFTLPTPTVNATIGVFAGTGLIAGSSPVTITASSGSIVGVGQNAASMSLGILGAYAVLQGNGSNWLIVAGQLDTGWVALTFPGGWGAASGFYFPAYRKIGNTARLRGGILNSTGVTQSGVATMANGAPTPAATVAFPLIIPTVGGATGCQVTTGGLVQQTAGNSILNGQVAVIDNVQYDVA